jgi:aryl-alcohol dehydrogenase-like predicted oxidoreductase
MINIALGAVQFGMKYGVSNQAGQTEKYEVKKILEYASEKGINIIDTAPSYGDSEIAIGDSILGYGNNKYWNVVTKTPNFKVNAIENKHIDKLLENFYLSRVKLKQKIIYGLLVHNCDDLFLPGGEKIFSTMEALKKEGLVKNIGVSVYNGEQIDRLLDKYSIDLVQLPINILDQRLMNSGRLSRLKELNVEIHARSAFLQGLLLMPINSIPFWFKPILKVLDEFHLEAKKRGMSVLELAFGFVHNINEIDKVVVGVNTLEQLQEIVNAASIKVNTGDFSNLSINNTIFINPSNWKV